MSGALFGKSAWALFSLAVIASSILLSFSNSVQAHLIPWNKFRALEAAKHC